MTTFVLTPARTFAADATALRTPQAMLEAGHLRAYTLRANGTMRHLDLAPIGSTRRDTAEYVSERLEDGATVQAVSRELHISVATVRRYLLSLEITESIEAGEWDDLRFDAAGEPVWAEGSEEVDAAELATDCGWDRCATHGSGDDIAADQDCPGAGADLDLLSALADSLA